MSALKVLLVDDEYLALSLLENFIKDIPDLDIVAKTKSPITAIDILNTKEIDLLFLDIQMPIISGINLLKTLKKKPAIIFTTAYSEYAVDAFGLDAVDYLLKPFSFERFLQAVNKAKEQLKNPKNNQLIAPEEFLTVKADGKLVKVLYNDILYIEGLKEYVRIVTVDENYVTLISLKKLADILPQQTFLRCHKSYIVNCFKVKSIEGNLLHLKAHKIPVSREKKSDLVLRVFG